MTTPNPPRWRTDLAAYAEHLAERGHTPGKTYGYLRLLRGFAAEHCASRDLGPWEVTADDLDTWRHAHHWSQPTHLRAASALRGFYVWAVATGRTTTSPAAGMVYDHRAPGPPRRVLPVGWDEALAAYLTHLRAAGRTESTIGANRDRLVQLAQHVAAPGDLTTEHLETWLAASHLAPETRRGRRSTARAFYSWAVRSGRLATSPAEHLAPARVPRSLPRPIPAEPLAQALTRADDRLRLALLLAACAGLRRAEVASLRWSDLDLGRGLVIRGKGGHERRVPMHPALTEALCAEHSRRASGERGSGFCEPYPGSEAYVFASSVRPGPIGAQHLGKLAAATLPGGWTLHTLRHRFATDAYAAQRDLRAVQELLGHTKPETTARYAATPDDALAAAVLGIADPARPRPATRLAAASGWLS